MQSEQQLFAIDAKTCTLKYNSQKNGDILFGSDKKFVIPIYQRPYSWTDEQIKQFLSDIFISFWGNEGEIVEEPMFIGTMQLSDKNDQNEQNIIDGQQRLTTFLVLLKVLKLKFPGCEELKTIGLNWLSTRVNNGNQQSYLKEIIDKDLLVEVETLNPYLNNAVLIDRLLDEQVRDENGGTSNFEIDRFIKYLLSNVYFVIIETRAGLSKTLQIFKAINTTGLDLDGSAIFKIRMFEYLTDKKGMDDKAFVKISKLYQKIDSNNLALKYNATNIGAILHIYQYTLIAKYNLPVTLYSYGTETFFERLFDTMFNVNPWEHFKNNVKGIELSLEDIESIINVRYEWENNWNNTDKLSAEDVCAAYFIELYTRYGRYKILIYVFLNKFKGEDNYWDKMLLFTRQLNKLYTIYSIRFAKQVNDVHSFTYSLIKDIVNGSLDSVMNTLNRKIGKLENHSGWHDFKYILTDDIASNPKTKNLVCRLSAMLHEDYKTTDSVKINEIENSLFKSAIDIEHIQSYLDSNKEIRQDILDEWQSNINSLGNLMVLEQAINRSLSNSPYKIKAERYPSSFFSIVKNHPINYSSWDLANCKTRKDKEVEKILDYIFD